MTAYLISLAAGVLIGIVYGLLNVRSPAPPVVALVGLLGMLIGEQVLPIAKQWLPDKAQQVSAAGLKSELRPHILGEPPSTGARNRKE
jgi:XapX domain-containing protein